MAPLGELSEGIAGEHAFHKIQKHLYQLQGVPEALNSQIDSRVRHRVLQAVKSQQEPLEIVTGHVSTEDNDSERATSPQRATTSLASVLIPTDSGCCAKQVRKQLIMLNAQQLVINL